MRVFQVASAPGAGGAKRISRQVSGQGAGFPDWIFDE